MAIIINEIKSFLKALLCFLIATVLIPILFLSAICVYYSDALVNYVLSIKYPDLTISRTKKIRTMIDTPRNAGIFHFLLKIKGVCDLETIRRHYAENLTEVRDKTGLLKFPKLRQKLVTCWGHYAWVNDTSTFNLNNHIVQSSRTYRGRPLNDGNIQEFVSDLITKYIPSDLPQWQVTLIPNSISATSPTSDGNISNELIADDHYYILIKVHHLLIAEEEDLHISELLMLHENNRKPTIEIDDIDNMPKLQSPSYFVRKPVHIQRLFQHIKRLVINRWNAFIYEFESLETPDGDGYRRVQITNLTQLISVLLIIVVNVCIEYWRAMNMAKRLRQRVRSYKDNGNKVTILTRMLLKECDQRNLSWSVTVNAVRSSCHPTNIAKTWVKFIWHINVHNLMLLPYRLFLELSALRDLLFKGQTNLTTTYCRRLWVYLPMMIYAQLEFFKICYEIFKAPVNIYEEMFRSPSHESNILQMKSYSGRKIVSFTKSIDACAVRKRITFSDEVRESDFVLSCLAGAMYDYFENYANIVKVPKALNTTCRTIAKGYFTEGYGDKMDNIGGIVFLQLPLKSPDREHARQMHTIVENIRKKQIMIYLASMGQTKYDLLTALVPRVLTKICINFFAFNFPVTITEIHGATSEFYTIWDQEVEDVLLFRPPQSKTCLSLNIHRFGDKYRLAIMADTQLGPEHAKIAQSFESYMESVTL